MATVEAEIHVLKEKVDKHGERMNKHEAEISAIQVYCAGEKEITASIRQSLAKLEAYVDKQQSTAGRVVEKIATAALTALTVAFVMWLFQRAG
jgi:archaellum component FlaC